MEIETSYDNFSEVNYPHFHEAGNFLLDLFSVSLCFEIIIGNLLVIVAGLNYKCFGGKSTNRYIISLAISDLLIGFVVIPLNIFEFADYHVLFRCQEISFVSSIYNLTVLSMDRYLAIRHPIRYSRELTSRTVNRNIAIVWILTFLITWFPYVVDHICWYLVDEFKDENSFHICDFLHGREIFLLIVLLTFYIPLILMSCFNAGTYHLALQSLTLQQRRRRSRKASKTFDNDKDNPEVSRFSTLIKQNKLSFTLCLIMIVFIIFWAPFFIVVTILSICPACENFYVRRAHYYGVWFGILNSGVNPIIHFTLSRKFRKATVSLLKIKPKNAPNKY